MLRLVHLSDVHYRIHSGEQNIVIRNALEDIKRQFITYNPTAFLLSGDIVHNPDQEEAYSRFFSDFIYPLSTHFGLPLSRFVACPGNHDVSHTYGKSKKMEHDQIVQKRESPSFIYENIDSVSSFAKKYSSKFFEFSDSLAQSWSNPFVTINIINDKLQIVSINSAFSCSLEGSRCDEARLALSIEHIENVFSSLDTKKITVVQIHHPIEHLSEKYRLKLQPLIDKYANILCFGHIHNARPSTEISGTSLTTRMQAGALHSYNDYFKGYSILTIDENDGEKRKLHYRTFWDTRLEFDSATNICNDGTIYSPKTNAADFESEEKKDPELFAVSALEAAEEIRSHPIFTNVEEGYIEPLIKEVVGSLDDKEDGNGAKTIEIELATIANSKANFLINSVSEGGGTTLLRELSARIYEKSAAETSNFIAVYIDAKELPNTEHHIEREIKRNIPDALKREYSADYLLKNTHVTVLIDNSQSSSDYIDNIYKIIQGKIENFRIVILLNSVITASSRIGLKITTQASFRKINLLALDRLRARRFINKYNFQDAKINREQLLDEIISRFRALGIPMTPVYLGLYLAVIDTSPSFNPINTSTLVDRFVEAVLQRSRTENIFRGEFDYDNQRSALASIAEFMVKHKTSVLTFAETIQIIDAHLNEIAVSTDTGQLLETFTRSRILYRNDNKIGFTSSVFMSYFTAIRMNERSDFFDWIFTGDTPLYFISTVEIYCGLFRSDASVLNHTTALMDKYHKEILPIVSEFDAKKLVAEIPINSENLDRVLSEEAERAEIYGQDREKLAKEISEQEGPISGKPAKIPENQITSIVVKWLMALALNSVAIKNLENIRRTEKEPRLEKILSNWGLAASFATYGMALFVDNQKPVRIGDLSISLILPEDVNADFIRNLVLRAPLMLADQMKILLGTQKLTNLLKEINFETKIDEFLSKDLLAEIDSENEIELITELSETMRSSEFLSRVLYLKTMNRYVRNGKFNKKDQRLKLIATLHANCKALNGPERAQFISKRTLELQKLSVLKENSKIVEDRKS